jgi:hypothetical protein
MNKIILISFFACAASSFAQVGIGTTAPAGALDITSTTNGILVPRVSLTSKATTAPIVNPVTGLAPVNGTMVFNIATSVLNNSDDVLPGLYFFNTATTRWVFVGNDPTISIRSWEAGGNTATNSATDFCGTTDNQDVVFRRNNIRAGLLSATSTSFGVSAARLNSGAGNSAFGVSALDANTTATNNSAFGASALLVNTAANNSAYGAFALDANTTGTNNAAFGINALGTNITSNNNSAFGSSALAVNTGADNSA